jgi:hypothetical protein
MSQGIRPSRDGGIVSDNAGYARGGEIANFAVIDAHCRSIVARELAGHPNILPSTFSMMRPMRCN